MIDYKNAKGWLRPEEREALFDLAYDTREYGIIVNIGVEYGASLACLRVGNPSSRLIGIDIDCSKVANETIGRQCELKEGNSSELVKKWTGLEIDLLFIDGDHSYEGVKKDLAWLKYVRPGGYVIFHDCYDFDDPSKVHEVCPGVNQAVSEWKIGMLGMYASYQRGLGEEPFPKLPFEELDSVGTMRIFRRVE